METQSKPKRKRLSEEERVRKPQRHSDEYKCNKIKRAKVTGVEHTNHKGKTIAARKTGEDCR